MPDDIFEDPRLAGIYDSLDPDRSDLDAYAAIADEVGARSVLDVGCGTGTLACMLARRGIEVVGVDPAGPSLDIARAKPDAGGVRWIHGDATMLPPLAVDLATMTANVAQVFLTDEGWSATLGGIHSALNPCGYLVFETRDPARQAWREWNREATYTKTDIVGVGIVEAWCEVLSVRDCLVTFRWTHRFAADGAVLSSDSTLRFRDRAEIEGSLREARFELQEVRDASHRPGREFVVMARAMS